jgi:serine protease AprX
MVRVRPNTAAVLACIVLAAVLGGGTAVAAPRAPGSAPAAPAGSGDRVDVIVRGIGSSQARRHVGDLAVRHNLPIVDGFSARVTAGQARALVHVPGVVGVDAVRTVHTTDTATDRDFGAALARQTFSATGAGVGICVIDTGIDPAHEQIAPRPVVFRDFIGTATTSYDDHGHGTHVASIAAGDGNSVTGTASASAAAHIGVAPAADLYAAKVLDAGGSGPDDGVLAGIQWCAAQPAVDVLSMSLGDSVPSDGTDPMSAAVNSVTAAGKVVVVAAGNAGDAPSTVPSPGAAASAITVGAVSDWSAPAGTDYRDAGIALAPFSSRGPAGSAVKPDVTAPGVTVSAAAAGTGTGYVALSGTSRATPYVAGVVALGLQQRPTATPAQVSSALQASAVDRGQPGKDNDWGAGLVDAEAFVQALTSSTNAVATAFPTFTRRTGSVPDAGSQATPLTVTDTSAPLAVTITITSGSQGCILFWPGQGCVWPGEWSPDLDADLLDPSGQVVATSECALSGWFCTAVGRQETLLVDRPVLGTYTLRVRAWNGGPGGTYAADVSSGPVTGGAVQPPPPNQPPTVSAGPDKSVVSKNGRPVKVTLTGTASDGDGTVTRVWWTNAAGTTVGSTLSLSQSLAVGSYTFTLHATDDDGASAADSAVVTVTRR